MLRLACCLVIEQGLSIIAPVHDAVLIEAPESVIEDAVAATQAAKEEASAVILEGFRLRTEAKIVHWPGGYMDARGREFWGRVMALLDDREPVATVQNSWLHCDPAPCGNAGGPVRKCRGPRAEMPGNPCNFATPA
jgi:hypothetical protein